MGAEKNRPKLELTRILMIIPAIVWTVIFLLVPLIIIVITSFYTEVGTGYAPVFTLQNYAAIFGTSAYLQNILFTVAYSAEITAICVVMGFPLAYYLALKVRNENVRLMLILIFIIPFWVDFTTKLMAWFPILGARGAINYFLLSAGLVSQPVDALILSPTAATIVMVNTYVLFMAAPILLSLGTLDPVLFQAAESLGAGTLQIFRHVTLPLSRPGIIIGCAFVFVMVMGDYVTPRAMGGSMQTVGLIIAQTAGYLRWPTAGAFSVVMIAITLAVVFILFRVVKIARLVF